jgi:hypothetical protein
MNRHCIAIYFCPGRPRDVGFPMPIVGRANHQSPDQHQEEQADPGYRSFPERSNSQKEAENTDQVDDGRKSADLVKSEREIQGAGCPKRETQENDRQKSVRDVKPK